LEALVGTSLDTPIGGLANAAEALKWACSSFLASPQFQLTGVPTGAAIGTHPRLRGPGQTFEESCNALAAELPPDALVCSASTLQFSL
jgi:hypothetical protein